MNKEYGFFHPEAGYWQTLSAPSDIHLAQYPEGTFEVPLKPGRDFSWNGNEWIAIPPKPPEPLTPEQITSLRHRAYVSEADPLFFKAQRGEATQEEWLAKIAEIKARYS